MSQFTADQIEEGITSAIKERKLELVPDLLKMLAVRDPRRAELIYEAIKTEAMPPPQRLPERCPATYRHIPSHSLMTIGVQCKYTRVHEGDHAGHSGFGDGDVFWPQDAPVGSPASG